MIQIIALIAAVALPFFNIPLVIRILKRRSAADISIYWACGVWFCLLIMFPAGLLSEDIVWKVFNIFNFILFSSVFVCVLLFHNKGRS